MLLLLLNALGVLSRNCYARPLGVNLIGRGECSAAVAFVVGHSSCYKGENNLISKSKVLRLSSYLERRPRSREAITSRNLFSFNLNNGKKDEGENGGFGTGAAVQEKNMNNNAEKREEAKGSALSWPKNLMVVDLLGMTDKRNETTNQSKRDGDKNGDSFDDKTRYYDADVKSNRISSNGFPLANIINVEALLMASGKIPLLEEVESDPGAALLLDMVSESNRKPIGSSNGTRNDFVENTTTNPVELSWDAFTEKFRLNVMEMAEKNAFNGSLGPRSDLSISTDFVINQAIQGIESFLNDATATFSQERVQNLILAATRSLSVDQNADVLKSVIDNIVATAENLAREQGVDVSEAAAQARATTRYTTEFLRVANGVLLSGYVQGGEYRNSCKRKLRKK
jgi:hypothetical protein